MLYRDPGPPSSHSPSPELPHVFVQPPPAAGVGIGVGTGTGADPARTPQSVQSDPYAQMSYKEPGPPSSHSLSPALGQLLLQTPPPRGPQSVQSVPRGQMLYSEPGPPSSHSPSPELPQVFMHWALAPMAKKPMAIIATAANRNLILLSLIDYPLCLRTT